MKVGNENTEEEALGMRFRWIVRGMNVLYRLALPCRDDWRRRVGNDRYARKYRIFS